MTREEATKILRKRQRYCKVIADHANATVKADELREIEAIDIALSALRPVSREHVERVWRGEWIKERGQTYIPVEYDEQGEAILHDFVVYRCSICGRENTKEEPFCNCGAPMTDEAVEMVMERIGETRNG